jgi:hypothetical protein
MPGMMRFAASEEEGRLLALFGWQIETMHGG